MMRLFSDSPLARMYSAIADAAGLGDAPVPSDENAATLLTREESDI